MDTTTKSEARVFFRALRDGIDGKERQAMDRTICEAVCALDSFDRAETVLLYHPIGSEVDVRPMAEAAWAAGKRVAFPRVTGPSSMDWQSVGSFDELMIAHDARLSIPEPPADPATLILSSAPSEEYSWDRAALAPLLVFVPGLAFDEQGYRLGYGGGYYDVFLSLLAKSPIEATTMGVAYPSCIVESLEHLGLRESHDHPVDVLVCA